MRYFPHTDDDVRRMLAAVGVDSTDALFADIPAEARMAGRLALPEALGEAELLKLAEELAARDRVPGSFPSFLGGGAYDHYVPAAVDQLISRGEFYTAYTPYQPEISQGTLQAVFEFQSMIAALLDMDVANASMYDGATALAEAVVMARRVARGGKVVLAGAIHPEHLRVVRTYTEPCAGELVLAPFDPATGTVSPEAVARLVDDKTAALVVQHPNFFGTLEDLAALGDVIHAVKGLLVVSFTEPLAFGLLKPPGSFGADVVVGEGQSLGLPLSLGGPYLGLFSAREQYVRSMPGRLVGQTTDVRGEESYVLTLATREQHIRRERATSNICTNEGLCALTASVYLSLMGPLGLNRVATVCHRLAERLKARLRDIPGVRIPFASPSFHEFVAELPFAAATLCEKGVEAGLVPGLDLGRFNPAWSRYLLLTVTEKNTLADLDVLVAFLSRNV
jgi:glycine dehydrogenase subunit 1